MKLILSTFIFCSLFIGSSLFAEQPKVLVEANYPEYTNLIAHLILTEDGQMVITDGNGMRREIKVSKINMDDLARSMERLDRYEAKPFSRDMVCYKMPPKHYRVVKVFSPSRKSIVFAEENYDCTASKGFAYNDEAAENALEDFIESLVIISKQAF